MGEFFLIMWLENEEASELLGVCSEEEDEWVVE